jgi:hypothetical protein
VARIAYVVDGGIPAWVCTFNNGAALRFSEHITDAAEFVDDAAITTFMTGKHGATFANGRLFSQTAGQPNYGKRQH